MVKDMRFRVSGFAPQISPLIQDGMFQLGCQFTEDMFHLLRGHDPWASWRRGVALQTPLPPRMCGKVARNGQTSLPIVLASSRMIGKWKLQGRCRLADVHLASLELGMKSFFVHICTLFGKMNDGFPTLPEKKTGPKHSFKTSRPNILLAIWRVTFATATLAFQWWAPYLNKSIDMFKTLG